MENNKKYIVLGTIVFVIAIICAVFGGKYIGSQVYSDSNNSSVVNASENELSEDSVANDVIDNEAVLRANVVQDFVKEGRSVEDAEAVIDYVKTHNHADYSTDDAINKILDDYYAKKESVLKPQSQMTNDEKVKVLVDRGVDESDAKTYVQFKGLNDDIYRIPPDEVSGMVARSEAAADPEH